jgi:hypothetical protein
MVEGLIEVCIGFSFLCGLIVGFNMYRNNVRKVELTDEEIWVIKMSGRDLESVSRIALLRFARRVEAKLKEKR